MNMNHLVRRIKDELGLTRFLQTSYTDHDIAQIIEEHAVKDFSRYFKAEVEVGGVDLVDKIGPDVWLIPDWVIQKIERSNLRLEDIKYIRFNNNMNRADTSSLGTFTSYYGDYLTMETAYAGLEMGYRMGGADLFHEYLNSCYFEKPNRIRFVFNNSMNFPGSMVNLSLYVGIAPNLLGVDVGREHEFYNLAKLCVMDIIYNNEAKYIDSISSGIGNLNLKVDEWQSAKERKEELLQKMYNESIRTQNYTKVI